jgi:hypothetical protein
MNPRHIPTGLTKIAAWLEQLDKAAAAHAVPYGRAAGYGALAGLGVHVGRRLLSDGEPADPDETAMSAAGKSAIGGAAAAGLLNLLNRLTTKR